MVDINQKLATDLRSRILEFPEMKILLKSSRAKEEQIRYVLDRWSEYPSTRREFMEKFSLAASQLPGRTDNLTKEQNSFLRYVINRHSTNGTGFRHLKGHAIDISVAEMRDDIRKKELLRTRIKKLGYKTILERPSKYYVSIDDATTFHVELTK